MILVIGGAGQGQLAVALRNTGYTEGDVTRTLGADKPVLSGLQEAVRNALLEGKTQEQILAELLWHEVVVSDEVGCGVVPMEPFEREWRCLLYTSGSVPPHLKAEAGADGISG